MSSRVRWLLGIAAVLAVMRFVVVPWIDAQDDDRDRLYAVTRQLDRAEAIVDAGSDLEARRDALAAVAGQLAARAPYAEPGSEHRVQVQRQLRAAVEAAGCQMEVFEWVLDGEIEEAGLNYGRVRLRLGGSLREIAEAHVAVEAGMPYVLIRDLSINLRRAGGLGAAANATIELDLYYRSEEDA